MQRVNTLLRRLPTWPVWALGCVPLGVLMARALAGDLGPDPVRGLQHPLGLWGLRLLIASLAVTPLMRAGLRLVRFRRAVGVLGFAYVALHFLVWVALDMGLRWPQIAGDLVKRPYILAGFAAFLLLVPLALTSTDAALRRLGARRWRRLHRLAYVAIPLGALHFAMIGKLWTVESLAYLAVTAGLLALRLVPAPVQREKTA
ncbi:sulfoxide reductase heme-binding subunit YedZ [Rhodobacter sp. Har01]|uniref:sulfite oxidase heme-binding subunit YedZ n=1 Tax=Rhodobacter sp. Har01 TaxID=2883999 RepID=UPI001D08B857|nr:protein-methionine-sulfoxide reductase heme-binding subunit MsrQ [Rhodobacter sp. Har01]MCB6178152.1 sulfoxide reductase heme-binding subunit YedZ [Rhodobacter sp. Har01]